MHGWGNYILFLRREKYRTKDFPGGRVVKNQPSNARDAGLIPDLAIKSHTLRATNPDRSTKDPACPTKTRCSPPKIKRMTFFKVYPGTELLSGELLWISIDNSNLLGIYKMSNAITHTLNH